MLGVSWLLNDRLSQPHLVFGRGYQVAGNHEVFIPST